MTFLAGTRVTFLSGAYNRQPPKGCYVKSGRLGWLGLGPIIWGTLPFVVLIAVAVVILSAFPGIAGAASDLVYGRS